MDPIPISKFITHEDSLSCSYFHFPVALAHYHLPFLPYLRLKVKIFQFLRLATKFLAVLRVSVNPIDTLF